MTMPLCRGVQLAVQGRVDPQPRIRASVTDEIGTAERIDWFNHHRLHGEIGHIPPAEFETSHYADNPACSAELATAKSPLAWADALPGREPQDQPRHPYRRGVPDPPRRPRPGLLHRRKLSAGKTRMEAMRCLKRRISDALYRQLRADAGSAATADANAGPGGAPRGVSCIQRGQLPPAHRRGSILYSRTRTSRSATRLHHRTEELRPPRPLRPPLDNRGEPK